MNKEYQTANEKAQELMNLVDALINGIAELKKLEIRTHCEDRVIKDHKIKMIKYMEREVVQLSHSVDSYLEAETTAR